MPRPVSPSLGVTMLSLLLNTLVLLSHLSLTLRDSCAVGSGRGRPGEHVGERLVLPRDAEDYAQLPQHPIAAPRRLRGTCCAMFLPADLLCNQGWWGMRLQTRELNGSVQRTPDDSA